MNIFKFGKNFVLTEIAIVDLCLGQIFVQFEGTKFWMDISNRALLTLSITHFEPKNNHKNA